MRVDVQQDLWKIITIQRGNNSNSSLRGFWPRAETMGFPHGFCFCRPFSSLLQPSSCYVP